MKARLLRQERRSGTRPANGDVRACPNCGQPTCEFSERFRFDGTVVPAWVCGVPPCRYREVVRHTSVTVVAASGMLRRAAMQVQARAKRTMLKARAQTERSQRHINTTRAAVEKHK